MAIGGMEILNNRPMSSYPVSIGTSLALESFQLGSNPVYDEGRIIPNQVDISDYDYFYINISTLYRNMITSISTQDANEVFNGERLYVLHQEIETIKSIVKEISKGNTKLVFYVSKYSDMKQRYPYAFLRIPTTDNQKVYDGDLKLVVSAYIKDDKEVEVFHRDFEPKVRSKILIMTHYAHDLLNYKDFAKFDLLESHTGILKTPSMFYTKLLNGKDLNRIQFNTMSIQVFGDRETFSPMPIKVKRLVLDLAEKYNWTQATTRDRYYYCFNMVEDLQLRDMLKSLIV